MKIPKEMTLNKVIRMLIQKKKKKTASSGLIIFHASVMSVILQ